MLVLTLLLALAIEFQSNAQAQISSSPLSDSPDSKMASTGGSAGRLNVLFLISDDLRPELGCYGNSIIQSPNIDRLAQRGMVFNRAYCQQAVCSPSRSSVMTGARPDTTKVWDLTTHFRKAMPDVVTLSQLFKDHGYVSKGLGKIYHGDALDDPLSWSDVSTSGATKSASASTASSKQNAKRPTRSDSKRTDTPSRRGPAFRINDDPPNGGSDGKAADEAIASLQEFKASSQPFFLAVGFRKPHLPFSVPKPYWDLYDPQKIPPATNPFLPHGAPAYALVDRNEMWKYAGVPDTGDLPLDYARQLKHGYYAAVSYMDAQLGRVVDELDRLGLRENTIVILWGDHGWKLGEHHRWCKHSNVEDDTRAPLIVSVPGMKNAGRSTNALVEFVDIYPTIAQLANVPLPLHLEGTSAAPLLDDPSLPWKTAAFSQYPRTVEGKRLMGYSMRTDRYRFTRWVHRNDPTKVDAVELYDHRNDPQENTNIADLSDQAETVAELTQQWLGGWQNATPNP